MNEDTLAQSAVKAGNIDFVTFQLQQGFTGANATTTATSFTSTLSDSVTTSATVIVNSSGRVLIDVSSYSYNNGANTNFLSFSAAGANTIAAGSKVAQHKMGSDQTVACTFLQTGLNPGSTTFTLQYRVTGGTATFGNRTIIAEAK